MRCFIVFTTIALCGCTPYTDAQLGLIEQARRGAALVEQAYSERTAIVDALHGLQRKRLDAAFDADVRERAPLDAEWVIEHRQAYAVGLEALATQRATGREAERVTRSNLAAMQKALQRLSVLVGVQRGFMQTEVDHAGY